MIEFYLFKITKTLILFKILKGINFFIKFKNSNKTNIAY